MLMRSITTRFFSGITRSTRPRLPRSFPATTASASPFRTCAIAIAVLGMTSDDFGGQRDDLRELLVAKLPRHGTEDAGPDGIVVGLEEDHRVLVEADIRAVLAPDLLPGA